MALTGKQIGLIVSVVGACVLVLTMCGGGCGFIINQYVEYNKRQHEEQVRQQTVQRDDANRQDQIDREEKVELVFEKQRKEGETTIITVRNTATKATCAITGFRFIVTDPDVLKEIEKRIPDKGIGAQNPSDDVMIHEGCWRSDHTYIFYGDLGLNIDPNKPHDLKFWISSDKLKGLKLKGTLTIEYQGGKEATVPDVYFYGPK